MDEDQTQVEETPAAGSPDEVTAPAERGNGGGPGLLPGLLAGAFLGAIIALVLTPKPGERVVVPPQEAAPDDPAARVTAVLARVRHLMQEASLEAHQAAQETEERLRGRYSQLTSQRDGA